MAWPFVTADGKAILCTHEGPNGRNRIMLWTRPSTDVPFADFTYLEIPGVGPLLGRSPRYVDKTRELFFSAPTNSGANGDFGLTAELRVVRNFRLSDYLPKL